MKLVIWQDVVVSDGYHDRGGLLVVAENVTAARTLANTYKDVKVRRDEKPWLVVGCEERDPLVVTFPDTGCCG